MILHASHTEFMELSNRLIRTRGNIFKLVQHHCRYNLRKYNFTNRIIPILYGTVCPISSFLQKLLTPLKAV